MQVFQTSEGLWHLLLSRSLEVEIPQRPLQTTERSRSESDFVVGEFQRGQLGTDEGIIVDSRDLVHREIEHGEILQSLQSGNRNFRELVILEIQTFHVVFLALKSLRLNAPDATTGQLHVVNSQVDKRVVPQDTDRTIIDIEEIDRRLGGIMSHRRQQLLIIDDVALHRELAG